jgi:long-chain fatty acid transport protein
MRRRIWALLQPVALLGVTMGSNFGLGLDYGSHWSGRYYVQEGELVFMGVHPNIGYRVNDWLSVGAGVSIMYGELNQKVAVNNPLNNPDGQLKLDADDLGYGYNLGVLVEPSQKTRLGLTYRSKIDLEFEDAISALNLSPALSTILDLALGSNRQVDMDLTVPQAVMFSVFHQLNDQWAIMGNIGWQNQSVFGKTGISLASSAVSNSATADRNYHDTWHYAIGNQYRFAPQWLLSAGVAYDDSPVDDEDRTPDMPLDRQIRYATGLQYDVNEDLTIGAAYTFLDAGEAKIELDGGDNPRRGELIGDYSPNYINFFIVNMVYRF